MSTWAVNFVAGVIAQLFRSRRRSGLSLPFGAGRHAYQTFFDKIKLMLAKAYAI
jgi:hypothetical protein